MGFVKHCGKRWISSDDTTESTQDSTREALVAACSSFIQRGDEEKTMWENYLNQELGGIIGDPFAFDLRIKILDNAARKALKRAARQAMMDEMLARSKAKRSMASSPSNLVGVYKEFISSPRIDNQLSTWGAIQGICEFASDDSAVATAKDVAIAVSFDHEEVGSSSWTGADGATLPVWLERTMTALQVPDAAKPEMLTRSFLISADCAHGLHPNYAAKHQAEHRPSFHKGIVIKTNANQRYATTPLTAALFREVCKRCEVPVQDFVVRNDSPCGSTIGPIISSSTGVRTIDVGAPQWAMHSCRETCASSDALHMLNLSKSFYTHFRDVDNSAAKL
ncbi:unnamed protein product [Cladocopium goreaui]|uniref:aspartyl aminopeptidase n=1 Tax=Cladocopium goreaui TaxID=2562237 RepID=A0A9P1CH62_9DINO|nr:unnamed protein product [Cladocopium goreaui]